MVRSSRFCFDDGREPDRDEDRDHFCDEDERLLDEFVRESRTSRRRRERKRRPDRPTKTPTRHLATADQASNPRSRPLRTPRQK